MRRHKQNIFRKGLEGEKPPRATGAFQMHEQTDRKGLENLNTRSMPFESNQSISEQGLRGLENLARDLKISKQGARRPRLEKL